MTVEPVTTREAVHRHAEDWRALGAAALHGNPVGDAVMVAAALDHLVRPGEDVRIALAWRSDEAGGPKRSLTGVFIFRMTRVRWGLPIAAAVPWGHRFSFTSTPLVHPDHARATFAAFFGWLDGELGGVPMLFEKLPAEGPLFATLEQYLISSGRRYRLFDFHKRAVLAADRDPEGWFVEAVPSRKRKELRRQRNRLEEMGGLAFEEFGPGADVTAWIDDFLALEAAGWKGRSGSTLNMEPELEAFVRAALAGEARDGRLGFWKLSLAGRPIAMTFAVKRPPQAWLLKIAHDESLARFSPGVQLMLDVSRAFLADPDVAWVDSCADAGHPMIEHLWRERFAVTDMLVAGGGSTGFDFLCAAEDLRRHARSQAKRVYHLVKEGVHR